MPQLLDQLLHFLDANNEHKRWGYKLS